MPYFEEIFVNQYRKSEYGAGRSRLSVRSSARVLSHRSRPHRDAISWRPVSDVSADPYAHFISSTDKRRYEEALRLRGLPPQGGPDVGHPFEVVKHTIIAPSFRIQSFNGSREIRGAHYTYDSSFLGSIHNGSVNRLATFDQGGLSTFAQQAYNRTAPTSVVFDAANFLGELREGLPRLALQSLKDQSRFFKGLGGDYLNVVFGWQPFIRDLQNAAKALYRATMELSRQGQRVHRRYSAPPTILGTSQRVPGINTPIGWSMGGFPEGMIPSGFPMPSTIEGYPVPLLSSSGTQTYEEVSVTKTVTQDRWFEGEFTSFYPLGFDPSNYFDRLNQLVNTKVTPSVLWNLAPWSWLVDWHLRISDTIEANETRANDLLVMHYGYAMERTVFKTSVAGFHPMGANASVWPPSVSSVSFQTHKRRIRANPYGFRVGGASALSSGQLAILVALGLTKAL